MNGFGNSMNGLGYLVMGFGALVFWVLIVAVVVTVGGYVTPLRSGRPVETPDQILAARFARGDIDHDEYVRRQAALSSHRHGA